jgi:ATP-dependent Lon protease
LPNLERRELIKDRLLRMGEIVLIDNVEARVDLKRGQRWAKVPAINDERVRVSPEVLEQHPGMLLGGLWGTVRIHYSPETDPEAPNQLASFTPFQIGLPDLDAYKAGRAHFTTDEWLQLMLQSAGYAPEGFPERRQRLLLLARLVPLVQRNVNFIELGPRQTGKTYLLRNVSPRVFTVSGGKTTPANLFVNLATRAVGILGTRKVVVFDEIAHTTFGAQDETISTLKDYMESGQFSRGNLAFTADASLVFSGNLDVEGTAPEERYRHLFEPLPAELIDAALLDRLHGFLPGWEISKMTPGSLSGGVGFLTDYLGEALARLREDDYQDRARSVAFGPGLTQRDQTSVARISSGLIKLLYPNGRFTDDDLEEVIDLACELRQRVHNQLAEIAPGEFKPRLIARAGLAEHGARDLRQPSKNLVPEHDRLNYESVVGAVTGLAVLCRDGVTLGGDLILVQVSAVSGGRGVEVTGLHDEVLKDSVRTAYNVVRSQKRELGVSEDRLQKQFVAVHLVRIAEPKEGPSAGIAFVVGIVSALTNRPVKPAVAMTGEVTLHGEVKGVGGLTHKVRAAVKAGRKLVIVPADNAREVQQLPDDLLSKIEVVPVRTIQEVIGQVLG